MLDEYLTELDVDALVVATTVRLGGGMVVAHDPADRTALAANSLNVAIAEV